MNVVKSLVEIVEMDLRKSHLLFVRNMGKPLVPKQPKVYQCSQCNRACRDNTDLRRHQVTCIRRCAERAHEAVKATGGCNQNVTPLSAECTSMVNTGLVDDVVRGMPASVTKFVCPETFGEAIIDDYFQLLVNVFKYIWLNNNHPELHNMLGETDDLRKEYLVFRETTWVYAYADEEILYRLKIASQLCTVGRIYSIPCGEQELQKQLADLVDSWHDGVGWIYDMFLTVEDMCQDRLLDHWQKLMNLCRIEIKIFTAQRGETVAAAKIQALEDIIRVHRWTARKDSPYQQAKENYMKYRDWACGGVLYNQAKENQMERFSPQE